tara:strand:- start:992 stop:1120 length:129 start_codon:yes stop_codon:yes gene_type:complete
VDESELPKLKNKKIEIGINTINLFIGVKKFNKNDKFPIKNKV